jgi:MFS family permease
VTVATETYRRDRVTWAAFGALFAFGFMNAVLGPALPYLRAAEGISYFVGALHQAAYAVGGGLAGMLAARDRRGADRRRTIAGGLVGSALAGLALGYGDSPVVTIAAALVMSLLGTAALIRLWAVLADLHGARRAVAMSEGEVAVSLAGIGTPLVIAALAATTLSWRFAFALGAGAVAAATFGFWRVGLPDGAEGEGDGDGDGPDVPEAGARSWRAPTLVLVFAVVALEWTLSFWLASYLDDDLGLSRDAAVAAVSGLYAASLVGRLLASRLARRIDVERLVGLALVAVLVGLPALLLATSAVPAAVGIAVAGIGIGATFPLASALHVQASPLSADGALGQVLTVAAPGQLVGPLVAGAIAQAAGLRVGLLVLPALTLLAGAVVVGLRPAPPRRPGAGRRLR